MSDKEKSKDRRKSLTMSSGSSKSKDKDKDKSKEKNKKDKRKTVNLTSSQALDEEVKQYTSESAHKEEIKQNESPKGNTASDKPKEVKIEVQEPDSHPKVESNEAEQKQLRKQISKKMSVRLLSIASKFVQDENAEKKEEKAPPPVIRLGELEGVKTTDIFSNALGSFKHLELMSPRVPLPGEATPRGTDTSAKLPTPRAVEVREPVLGTASRLRSASRAKGPKRRLPSKFEGDSQAVDQATLVMNVESAPDQSVTNMLDQRLNTADQKRRENSALDAERRQLEEEERQREEKINSQREQNRLLNSQLYKTAVKKAPERRHEIKFIHCKGKRRVWIRAVDVSYTSMNQGDTFVLDCDRVVYVWNGAKANQMEKAKAASVAEIVKSHERGGNAEIVKLDKNSSEEEMEQFWQALGGKGPIKAESEGGDDVEAEKVEAERVKLYCMARVTVEDRIVIKLNEIEQKDNKLLMDMLDQTKCFILDCGNELYAWQGRDSPEEDRTQVLAEAEKLFREQDRKPWSKVERVPQGGEPYLFRERFADWPDLSHPNAVKKMFRGIPKFNDDKPKHKVFTVSDMFVEVVRSDFDELDRADGNEEYTVWLIKDQQKIDVSAQLHGHFYSGNCYIVVYVYLRKNTLRHMIWTWEGKHCSKVDAGSAALLSKEEYKRMSRQPFLKQQTVFENKEPVQFLWAFKGKYFVHQGHYDEPITAVSPRLFHLRGTPQLPMHAIELEVAQASKLNSRDSFVLVSDKGSWVWNGRGTLSSAEHLAQSDQLTNGLHSWSTSGKDLRRCNEGEESNEFWELIGGKQEYANAPYLSQWDHTVRLFHVTQATATATFAAKEVLDFYQDDLVNRDAMILDAGVELFVWIGSKSNETKKKKAIEISVEYLAMAKQNQGRDQVQTYIVQEGFEPVAFKAHFHGWLDKPARHVQAAGVTKAPSTAPPKVNVMEHDEEPSGHATTAQPGQVIMDVNEALKEFHKTYTYDELMQPVPPPGVDKSCRENYLSEDDFLKVFGCSRAEYTAMPQWKRVQKKRATGLF